MEESDRQRVGCGRLRIRSRDRLADVERRKHFAELGQKVVLLEESLGQSIRLDRVKLLLREGEQGVFVEEIHELGAHLEIPIACDSDSQEELVEIQFGLGEL